MENSNNSDADQAQTGRGRQRRCFTPDALAVVLRDQLGLSSDIPLYIAYSGGMDSHVLLHALAGLRAGGSWQIAALHIDHALQPDSARWERHCATECQALGVPYRSKQIAVRDIAARGLEDAARSARYAALAAQLPAGAVLLTAHHRTDQAETLLLQLLRGTGVPGLAAMPAIAPFADGRLARPLLGFERGALADYAREHDLHWIDDTSNFDLGPARNYLRRRLWPVLSERWPSATERLAVTAGHLAEADRVLDEIGCLDTAACDDHDGGLEISALLGLSPERHANALRWWIRARTGAAPPEPALREIVARVTRAPGTRRASVRWSNVEVRRYRDRLLLVPRTEPVPRDWQTTWDPTRELEIPGIGWRLRARTEIGAGISRERIIGSVLQVRVRQGGESCRLRGHRRDVKQLLQEAGIPPWERWQWPLVYANDDLVAIGDRWVCEPYGASADETGWVLHLERRPER